MLNGHIVLDELGRVKDLCAQLCMQLFTHMSVLDSATRATLFLTILFFQDAQLGSLLLLFLPNAGL